MASSDNADDIIKAAQDLINQVQAQLTASDEELRRLGLDPQKVRAVASDQLTPQAADEAQAAFRADLDAIEQETAEEAARKSFGNASAAARASVLLPQPDTPMTTSRRGRWVRLIPLPLRQSSRG